VPTHATVGAVSEITPAQALAFRIAGHNLNRRVDAMDAIAACGLQEYPPGWSPVALHARSKGQPDKRRTILVNAMRGAPHLVPAKDVAIFTRALVPDDEKGMRGLVGSGMARELDKAGLTVTGALDQIAAAAREGLADGPLERDEFHQAMRERLPEELLPWCGGCKSHHVRPSLWRALGPLGVTVMPGKATWALAKNPRISDETAREELGRRFLRCFGPATPSHLAKWGQTAPAHAKLIFGSIADELAEVRMRGSKAWILGEDEKRLAKPPKAKGVRLLGGFDPLISQPDRETLVPDKALRKKMFPAVGRPGVILVDGEQRGLWKARKSGKAVRIELEWLGKKADVEAEAKAVGSLRGGDEVEVAEA
jgi:hypothetical protein